MTQHASQLDLLRDNPTRLAAAYREAAQSELMNPHFPAEVRQARHDHYAAIATRIEAGESLPA